MKNSVLTLAALLLAALPLSIACAQEADPEFRDTDVVVTESRYDAGTQLNVTNITQEEIRLREPDLELPLLLQGVPGVFAFSDAGSGLGYSYLKIRGFDQRRVGVLFNGIPFNDPEDHQIWWVNLPDMGASIQDIQVQRGVTNAVGGMTAIGGTVNIISRDLAETPGGMMSANFGSYGTQRQMLQYQTGDVGNAGFKSYFRLSRQQSDGYRDRAGHDGWGMFWSGQYDTENSVTRVNVYSGREITQHAWDAVPESVLRENRRANMETYHNAVDNFSQPHYELHHTLFLSDDVQLTNRVYHIKGEGFYENYVAPAPWDGSNARQYALDFKAGVAVDDTLDVIRQKWVRKEHTGWVPHLQWDQGEGRRLLVGGDWYTFHSDHWGDVLWAEGFTPADFVDGWKYHQYTGDKDQYSLYANQRWTTGAFTLTGELHYQHKQYEFKQNEVGNFTGLDRHAYTVDWDFFNPKGAVNYDAGRVGGGALQMYGSVGVNHREPSEGDLFDTWLSGSDLGVRPLFASSREVLDGGGAVDYVEWSDPYVQEERVVDYELGFSWRSPRTALSVGGYWMDFTDEIVPYGGVNEDGSSIRGNAGQTVHKGLELEFRARVGDDHTITLAASRSWDEFEEFIYYDWDGTEYDYSGNRIALFPEHLLMATWDTRWNADVRTRARLRNTGEQALDNSGEADRVIEAWTTVDLSLWVDLGLLSEAFDGFDGFVHVRNLADTEYETWGYWYLENYYTPGAGRNFAIGVDYTF